MTSQTYLNKPDDLMKLPPAPSKFGSIELQALILDNLTDKCGTCNGHGMIGGPSFQDPGEGGEPCPDCNDDYCVMSWPTRGRKYTIEFTIEHIGNYIDEALYKVMNPHPDLQFIMSEYGNELPIFAPEQMPIASGLYRAAVEFWSEDHTNWEDGTKEEEFGFDILSLERVRNLTVDEVLQYC